MADTAGEAKLWKVPVRADDVPEAGRRVKLSADAATRAAIAAHAKLRSLDRLEATFDLTRRGSEGLHVAGELNAAVGQVCVVTLDPIDNVISEKMDVDFLPASAAAHARTLADAVGDDGDDPPELLVEGTVDLGALAVEFLILSLDPYPRKPGAEFVAPDAETTDSGPFAALAQLKQDPNRQN